jgi:Flp pilus assembly pilin Flp
MTMAKMHSVVRGLWQDESGQDLVEYAALTGFIAVAVGAVFPPTVGPSISSIFSKVVSCLNAS